MFVNQYPSSVTHTAEVGFADDPACTQVKKKEKKKKEERQLHHRTFK